MASLMVAATMSAQDDDMPYGKHPIEWLPAGGNTVCYSRMADGFMRGDHGAEDAQAFHTEGYVSELTFFNNGDVYLKAPMVSFGGQKYIRGVKENNKLVFALPQNIQTYWDMNDEENDIYAQINRMENIGVDGYPWFDLCDGANEIVYTIADDGTITLESGYALGLMYTDDEMWNGCADTAQTFVPFNSVAATPPAGLEVNRWECAVGDYNYRIAAGTTDSEIWIQGLCPELPDAWIKGEINGDRVVIRGGQYLGITGYYYQYLIVGHGNADNMTLSPEIEFSYDAQIGALEPIDADTSMAVSSSLNSFEGRWFWLSPEIYFAPARLLVPQDPKIYNFEQNSHESVIYFRMPYTDVDGQDLDLEKYFFNMYIDGELYTFNPDEYEGIGDEPMVNVPVTLDTDLIGYYATAHYVSFLMHDIETIGVQAFYVVDGEESRSNRMVYNVATGEVTIHGGNDVKEIEAAPAAEEWYDLSGRKVENPGAGFYIKRTVGIDGEATVKKVMRGK